MPGGLPMSPANGRSITTAFCSRHPQYAQLLPSTPVSVRGTGFFTRIMSSNTQESRKNSICRKRSSISTTCSWPHRKRRFWIAHIFGKESPSPTNWKPISWTNPGWQVSLLCIPRTRAKVSISVYPRSSPDKTGFL